MSAREIWFQVIDGDVIKNYYKTINPNTDCRCFICHDKSIPRDIYLDQIAKSFYNEYYAIFTDEITAMIFFEDFIEVSGIRISSIDVIDRVNELFPFSSKITIYNRTRYTYISNDLTVPNVAVKYI